MHHWLAGVPGSAGGVVAARWRDELKHGEDLGPEPVGRSEHVVGSAGSEVVCSTAVSRRYDLAIVSTNDAVRRSLTTTPESEFGASWSRDGQLISFSRDVDERWQLLVIRPDGSDERQLAPEGVFSTWIEDGRLAWIGPGGIHVAAPDGSGEQSIDRPAEFISWRS